MNTEKSFSDKYLTRNETAKYFGVSRQAIYDWEKKGLITPIRKFGRTYFEIEDLEKIDDDDDELLTIPEALKYLKISRTTLWRAEKKGLITPVRKFGKARKFKKTELDKIKE
jgi:excisionase family DNA binding protein